MLMVTKEYVSRCDSVALYTVEPYATEESHITVQMPVSCFNSLLVFGLSVRFAASKGVILREELDSSHSLAFPIFYIGAQSYISSPNTSNKNNLKFSFHLNQSSDYSIKKLDPVITNICLTQRST